MKFWDSSELLVAHPCLCSKWSCTVHFKMTALCYMRFASKKNKQDLWYLVTAWNSAADIFQRLRESIDLLSACILLSKCMILSEQRTSGRTCTDSARLLFLSLVFFLSAHDCTVTQRKVLYVRACQKGILKNFIFHEFLMMQVIFQGHWASTQLLRHEICSQFLGSFARKQASGTCGGGEMIPFRRTGCTM